MKTIVGAALAFLFGTMLLSSDAEARCWWNGYNHCRLLRSWVVVPRLLKS